MSGSAQATPARAPLAVKHDEMLQQARTALREWRRVTWRADDREAEYTAACGMEQALQVLVRELS